MISSVSNFKVKYFKRLREKKFILEEGKYIVESEHLVIEAYKADVLECVITSLEDYFLGDVPRVVVSDAVLKSISNLSSVPKVMGVVRLNVSNEIKGNKLVLLDNVQDPGNVGTIIRCACAFNVSSVIFSPNSVSLYNDKMVRSSEGTIFSVNVVRMDLRDAIRVIKSRGIKVYYADMFGENNLDDMSVSDYALVLGSEGQGISDYVKEISDEGINIPMKSSCESLNVSVTGGIIMYKFR